MLECALRSLGDLPCSRCKIDGGEDAAVRAMGASHFSWFGGYGAEIRPIDDFGSAVVFDAAFNGEQGVGIGFQPVASRLTKKNGMHPVR